MARPLRLEFAGALYHVTSRGDRREAIFEDDADREQFLSVLADVVADFNWICHAYCLMTNHYHLLIETPDGNLSKGMRQLNGVFTQASNRRHARSGHLFQGRFKAILVDADSYLLELARYVVLNPVRAGMVRDPGKWPWSSYRAMIGDESAPVWLATDGLLAAFAKRRADARKRYIRFVAEGKGIESIWINLNNQVFLGDKAFVAKSLRRKKLSDDLNVPKAQRRPPPPSLQSIASRNPSRDAAIIAAHATGGYSYQQIAEHFGMHFTSVGRIVRSSKVRPRA
ncbi:MAG TPA: transposase [Dokdonella sp.]|uniref:REP-associated tyrosine transposase n=1 Tax=Dokdonella sp. TaxID=2291710 RepID=UPI002D7F31A2|nr:transposase [Dokdonella sp.]HET9032971.1 transposase [Dokdonella sp.]